MSRQEILSTPPLPATLNAIKSWRKIAENKSWIETMASMHSLELIADSSLVNYGAKVYYFNPIILESEEYTQAVKDFLREGYEADKYHVEEALRLVEKHSSELNIIEDIKITVLKSFDIFSNYLLARLERAFEIDNNLLKEVIA